MGYASGTSPSCHLAELHRDVASVPQELGDCRRLRREVIGIARHQDEREGGANGDAAGDERGAPRGAARLAVVVGEAHPFCRQAIEVRRGGTAHGAAAVAAEIAPADVVGHDHHDVRSLAVADSRRRRLRRGVGASSPRCRASERVSLMARFSLHHNARLQRPHWPRSISTDGAPFGDGTRVPAILSRSARRSSGCSWSRSETRATVTGRGRTVDLASRRGATAQAIASGGFLC